MKFTLVDEIPWPRDVVFRTHRDKLPELVPYLANVDAVEVRERMEDGDVVRLLNHWSGSSDDVPALIRPVLKPELLTWVDRAVWDQGRWRCDWNITLNALPDAITAKGYNLFQDEGDETVIQIQGEFTVHPDRIPGVPTLLARKAQSAIERFVVGLLEPNLRLSNRAVEQYLEDHA